MNDWFSESVPIWVNGVPVPLSGSVKDPLPGLPYVIDQCVGMKKTGLDDTDIIDTGDSRAPVFPVSFRNVIGKTFSGSRY
jgi:hypothetical protein